MSILLRGQSPEVLAGILAQVEKKLGHAVPSASAFRKKGNWLIKEQYLDELIRSPHRERQQHQLPGFFAPATRWGTCQLLWCRWFARTISAPISADAFRVKSNLRAFYVQNGEFSVKALLQGTLRNIQTFRNEVEIRGRIAAWGGANLPRLIAFDMESEIPFLKEELIRGHIPRRKADRSLWLSDLVPQLFALYRHFGLTWLPLNEVFDSDILLRHVREVMENIRWKRAWPGKGAFMEALAKRIPGSGGLVPCGLCHGDLSPGNLVVSKHPRIYILDWEMAKVQPIAFELLGLLGPDDDELIASLWMKDLSPPADDKRIMSVGDQFLFAAMARISRTAELAANTSSKRKKAKLNTAMLEHFGRIMALLGRENPASDEK